MKTLAKELISATVMTAILAVLLCGLYPLSVLAVAQGLFPYQSNGSIVYDHGTAVGSTLLGQAFAQPQYFHSRPSAAGNGYDATASGGSNLGPTAQALADQVRQRAASFRAENGLAADAVIPADAVTASGSGLDPHISVTNARLQAARVAKMRGWEPDKVDQLLQQHTEPRQLGVLGEPRVNVLSLNLALDRENENGR